MKNTLVLARTETTTAPAAIQAAGAASPEDAILARLFADEEDAIRVAEATSIEARRQAVQTAAPQSPPTARYSYD
jgi:hypothetical protein